MATVTKPMALDESIKTTESTSRNIADVLAQELSGIASAITGGDGKANKTDIATVEPTNTASRAYSVGELVYVNGNLYKVITAITSGATFTVGTNIQSTNVSGTVKEALDNMSAEDVSYGSGTVKDALDKLTANNGAVGVDLSSYSTSSNKYTLPSDGYIVEAIGAQTSGKCIVIIYGANGASITSLCLNATFNYQSSSVFVKKGMSCYVFSRDSNVTVEFRGLT